MWWNWAVCIPTQINPVRDRNGEYANIKQKGPVWFLAGCFEGEDFPRRKCVIPEDKSILFPVVNYEMNSYEKPELTGKCELLADVSKDIDEVIDKKVTIDGLDTPCFRIKSDPEVFSLKLPVSNCLSIQEGTIDAAADGYWVFLKPLPHGSHDIDFYGLCPGGIKLGAHYDLFVE